MARRGPVFLIGNPYLGPEPGPRFVPTPCTLCLPAGCSRSAWRGASSAPVTGLCSPPPAPTSLASARSAIRIQISVSTPSNFNTAIYWRTLIVAQLAASCVEIIDVDHAPRACGVHPHQLPSYWHSCGKVRIAGVLEWFQPPRSSFRHHAWSLLYALGLAAGQAPEKRLTRGAAPRRQDLMSRIELGDQAYGQISGFIGQVGSALRVLAIAVR